MLAALHATYASLVSKWFKNVTIGNYTKASSNTGYEQNQKIYDNVLNSDDIHSV